METELDSIVNHFLYTLAVFKSRGAIQHLINDSWFVRVSFEDAYEAGYEDGKAGLPSKLDLQEAGGE